MADGRGTKRNSNKIINIVKYALKIMCVACMFIIYSRSLTHIVTGQNILPEHFELAQILSCIKA